MRILAVRGKNLASLAAEFDVDFRKEPLSSAGLYAICGPTGSGKSTLLDALSVALYGSTPRLARAASKGVSLPDVGDETISPHDSRTLLRRGAADGFAEVDFAASDNVEYRARWSVRRSRGRSDGKLQNVEMSLVRLRDGQPIGGLKTEVLSEIEARLGLSFQQFTRAVLLAQNEFFAFLKADDNERAVLLEALTGTDTYTGISKRTYERSKLEQEALARLQDQLAGQTPLEPTARQELEREHGVANKAVQDMDMKKAELDRHLAWYATLGALQEAEREAQSAVDAALSEKNASEPRRVEFVRIEHVQNAKPFVCEVDRLSAEVKKHQAALQLAQLQLAEADKAYENSDISLTGAKRAVAEAEHAKSAAAADLGRARELDASIEYMLPVHAEAAENWRAAQTADEEARSALKSKRDELDKATQALGEVDAWLTSNVQYRLLAEGWARWGELLGQAGKMLNDLKIADGNLTAAKQDEDNKAAAAREAAVSRESKERDLREAEDLHEAAVLALSQFDAEALVAARKRLDSRRDLLLGAEQLWQELAAKSSKKVELERMAGEQRAAMGVSDKALAEALKQKPLSAAALEQAERCLDSAKAACAENVERLRESLQEGGPCPVCGSTEHPYAIEAPQHQVLDSLQREVDACRRSVTDVEGMESTHKALLGKSRLLLTEFEVQLESLLAKMQGDSARWDAHPVASELRGLSQDEQKDWFVTQAEAVREQLADLQKSEEAYGSATRGRNDTQARLDQVRPQCLAAQRAEIAAASDAKLTAAAVKSAAAKRDDLAARLETTLADLTPAIAAPDWREKWGMDPTAFHLEQKALADAWVEKSGMGKSLRTDIEKLDLLIEGLSGAASRAADHLKTQTTNYKRADEDLEKVRAERLRLLAGKGVTEVEEALDAALASAKENQAKKEDSFGQALVVQARAVGACGRADEGLKAQISMLRHAGKALASWITGYNTSGKDSERLRAGRLRSLVAYDGEWIARERIELQKLDTAIERASAVSKERQKQRESHESKRPTQDTIEAVQEGCNALMAELTKVKERTAELLLMLRQDDERLRRSTELRAEIDAQTNRTRTWSQLNELIGSADGKKFRNYAQQFTLDVLVAYANRHLADLSRRYRLERVKDTLSLLIVDQDMGEERRSVHSLSGGESFLVSLALALGLASLSSNRVRVESLFIDEGFGSLDAETLLVAMDALDNLQSQGRKVGVISHVQEMTERIATQIRVQRLSGGQSRIVVATV